MVQFLFWDQLLHANNCGDKKRRNKGTKEQGPPAALAQSFARPYQKPYQGH